MRIFTPLLWLTALLLSTYPLYSYAGLALSEYRLLFDAKNRADALLIRNTDDYAINYQVQIIHLDMTEEGTLIPVSDEAVKDRSAKPFIRFSPRRGLIQGNKMQAVRFSVRKPANLAVGEYRAVLRIISQKAQTQGETGVNLNAKISYSIPVIVRHGKLHADAELNNIRLIMQNSTPTIQLMLSLTGNRSLYGDFSVMTEDQQEIGRVNGIALYPPLNKRKVNIPLSDTYQGTVIIRFDEQQRYGGNISIEKLFQLK